MWTASVNIFSYQIKFFTKYLRDLAGANVSCIQDVEIFRNDSKKLGYSVKNTLVFAFERKLKVVDDFVRKFSCGPLPD